MDDDNAKEKKKSTQREMTVIVAGKQHQTQQWRRLQPCNFRKDANSLN